MTAFYKFTDTTGRYYPSLEINVATNDVVDFAPLGGSPPDPDRWTTSTGPATVAPGAGYTYPGGAATSPAPLLGPWVPNVAYVANQAVMSPSGTVVTRLSGGTSRATFDATEAAQWTVSGSTAYVALPSSPTDGQVLAWNATSGLWVPVTPAGAAEMAAATNGSNATQAVAAGGNSDITGCAISVTNSNGRPVYLAIAATGLQTSAPSTVAAQGQLIVYETTSGSSVFWGSAVADAQASADATQCNALLRLGAVTTTRTFKLNWGSVFANFTVQNNATEPGWAASIAALVF